MSTYTERARALRPYIVKSAASLTDADASLAPELFTRLTGSGSLVKAGTADNPIVWSSGMALIQNAYYTHNGEIKVWMGAAGATAKWTDAAFVPI